jgi:outer membrane protein assembly factor BamE (lipoprotein component of BamABCDE complex)
MCKTDLLIFFFLLPILATGCSTKSGPKGSGQPKVPEIAAVTLTAGLVEPGVGIKEVKLGATRAELEPSLGAPSGEDSNEFVEGQTYLLYHAKGVELTLQDDKVQVITLHAKSGDWSAYTGGTAEGAGVGKTSDEIVEALGTPEEEAPRAITYVAKGLKFRFSQDRDKGARAETMSMVQGG